ncbi:MAG: hypothetical protein L0Y44_10640 [Phycisphaerales bacterium]|nr:hypothetical protein [Phycisphaerales bacterium]MCI0675447.1 hypothetical protein [Phycisphaerales bacterium]
MRLSRTKTSGGKATRAGQTTRQEEFGSQGTPARPIELHEKQQQGAHDRRDASVRKGGEEAHAPREPKFIGSGRGRGKRGRGKLNR